MGESYYSHAGRYIGYWVLWDPSIENAALSLIRHITSPDGLIHSNTVYYDLGPLKTEYLGVSQMSSYWHTYNQTRPNHDITHYSCNYS